MRLTLHRDTLRDALGRLLPVQSGGRLPVLAMIRTQASQDGRVVLEATDLDVRVWLEVTAEVAEPGAALLPAKLLSDIAKESRSGALDLSVTETRAEVRSGGRVRFTLPTLPLDEWPQPRRETEPGQTRTLPAGALLSLAERVTWAAAKEQARPILNGALLGMGPDFLELVATNLHKLAYARRRCPGGAGAEAPRLEGIVHPKAFQMAARLFAPDEEVEVVARPLSLEIRGARARLWTRLVGGPYPNWRQVVPERGGEQLVAERAELMGALRRMALVASDQTHRLRLQMEGETLTLTAETPDRGRAQEVVAVDYQGAPLTIGFNAHYLLEILGALPGERVRFEFGGPERAARITPEGAPSDGEDDREELLCLCMPLRLIDTPAMED